MAAASNGEKRIDWMLRELKRHVDTQQRQVSQINLAVFGFSRGATQARAFVRMLTEKRPHVATLATKDGNRLLWHETNSKGEYPELVIYFMGLFDTVASVGYGGSTLEKTLPRVLSAGGPLSALAGVALKAIDGGGHAAWANDLTVPDAVRRCVHFVASHEVREKFPCDSLRRNLGSINSNHIEVFYPGMHSDVGGGYSHSAQEGRSNELANVALNNMFIEAWRAGVPLKEPSAVMADAGGLFEISEALEQAWNSYMGPNGKSYSGSPPSSDTLETNIIWHMNHYYAWRESRRCRLKDGRLKPAGGVDPYMAMTDKAWSEDVEKLVQDRAHPGVFTHKPTQQEQAILDAYDANANNAGKATPAAGQQAGGIKKAFDLFFDHYVHDSIAGFKQQMAESHVEFAEKSRWSVNRQYFMGQYSKDGQEGHGTRSLYWRYEGNQAAFSGTKWAALEPQPQSQQDAAAVVASNDPQTGAAG
jgi:hypothetical protein